MALKHSTADQQPIDSLPARVLIGFRSSIYTPAHIHSHAHRFLDNNWIDIDELKEFLRNANDVFASSSLLPSLLPSSSARVKSEPKGFDMHVKQEPSSSGPPLVKTRTLKEGAREVFKILSDSESEDVEEWPALAIVDLDASSSSSNLYYESEGTATDFGDAPASNDDSGNTGLQESDTVWQDPQISSSVRLGDFRVTKDVSVQRLEFISELPSIWPIPRVPTGFVLNLRDPKFDITDNNGYLYTVDALIKYKDNESWKGNTGTADSKVLVTFEPGAPAIRCHRSCLSCKGAFACENVDPALLSVVCHDLDPVSRYAVFAAQRETPWREGTTSESNATIFMNFVRSRRCDARGTNGNKCTGEPILRAQKQSLHGHYYFVGCSGWRKHFKEGHRMHSIPDNVDESLLAKLFSGQALAGDDSKDTLPCSCIVHPHTGLKQKYCPHAHITNGKSQARSRIQNHPCPAARTIYVPLDPTIQKALIIHNNNTPHNHPMPPLSKASLELKAIYRECIKATGCVGATVAKAPSTKILLDGKSPAEFAPALQLKQTKRKLVREAKLDAQRASMSQLFFDDLKKPIDERYIQSIVALPDGGIIILTCLAALMKLLDDEGVTSFEDDTTYKRVEGDINEWEVVIFLKALQRVGSQDGGYINCASTEFFEKLFDEFQKVKLNLTGKPVLGVGCSFFKLNDPAYSKISNDTPVEKVAPEIIKLCTTHLKRGPLEFKSLVSEQDYKRLLDFIYIDSKEKLDEFSAFVCSLGVKKIEDWWFRKGINEWIIPCLIKSQLPISSEDWDSTPSTTNTGEAQHHWTNSWQTATMRKARQSDELADKRALIQSEIEAEKEARRLSSARQKALTEELKSTKEKARTSRHSTVIIEANSSGRVKTRTLSNFFIYLSLLCR
ncbi:hypothetical protein B0H10DRAFT_1959922 [Mycena sp. CBHHK59/15]|nr:hypothetical protein B0H10DRAFT_1959922 [Mycena sp. CBHHK59/15]